MKIIPYSRLNAKNKGRVDVALARYETRPTVAHHSVISSPAINHVRSIVTISDPTVDIQTTLGTGKLKVTQISI